MVDGRRTAVVTGAAGGIGKAITKRLIKDGYRVVAGDADANGLKALSGAFNNGNQVVWEQQGDLRSKAYCEALIDLAIQFTGRPMPENRPCTITKSFSATIVPGSYLSVGGMLLMRLNRPSRPGAI